MPDQLIEGAESLTTGARRLAEAAVQKQQEAQQTEFGVLHWLLALLERHGPMVEGIAQGVEVASLQGRVREQLGKGETGGPLDTATVVRKAAELAQARGRPQATEADLARVILTAAGYELRKETPFVPIQGTPSAGPTSFDMGTRPQAAGGTPMLEQFGRDLTAEAKAGKLGAVVGRDEETQLVVETLCRTKKRNPVLIGPAGVGKTAIVEGLAQRIARGEVPEMLRTARLFVVQPSTLVAGAHMAGEFEKRMKGILTEASQDGILLFIDEVHSIIGSGGMMGTGDAASLLKPALSRGDFACLAATTDDEYRRFIEQDRALERRFQPIRVQELSAEQTLGVLVTLRDEFARTRGVAVSDEILQRLVSFAGEFLRNRFFPDKAVDLLEQCVANAVAQGKKVVEPADAQNVAQRMVGMPLALEERLATLKGRLYERALLTDDDAEALLRRFEVTLRGLDLQPSRPNAVVMEIGDAAAGSEALAETIAESLFGAPDRVVTIDFSRFTEHHHISFLIGAPPGYVGYSDELPLHRVAQMPWCVVRAENVHACHPQVLEVFTQALGTGFLTDARGKRIYLSDAVVLMTAAISPQVQRRVGLRHTEAALEDATDAAEKVLGPSLLAECDVVCSEVVSSEAARRRWLEKRLLADLANRYRKQGLDINWHESLIEWLMAQHANGAGTRDWERLVDQHLSPALITWLPTAGAEDARRLVVKYQGSKVCVETCTAE